MKLTKLIVFFLLILSVNQNAVLSQPKGLRDLAFAKSIMTFDLNENSNDFSFIDRVILNKNIIILSEDSHQDGATEELRSKLIAYLIKTKGFKFLITEASLHETYFINSCIYNTDAIDSCIKSIHNAYYTRKSTQELLNFIKDSTSKNSIYIGGLDIEIQGRQSFEKLLNEAEKYSEVNKFKESNKLLWKKFSELLLNNYFGVGVNNNISYDMYNTIKICVSKIRTSFKDQSNEIADRVIKDKIWENVLNYSFWTYTRPYVVYKKNKYDVKGISLFRSTRDSLMFENFKWLKRNICDTCKVIVVVSAYHSQKNFASDANFQPFMSRNAMTFGEYLNRSEFRNQTATFAFIASIGKRGSEYTPLISLPKMKRKSIEQFLFDRNVKHAFVTLKDIYIPFYMAPLFISSYIKTTWSKVFDGVFYNRIMYPNYEYK